MGKKLAIKGHSTRSKEVIELLEMLGGKNKFEDISFIKPYIFLFIDDDYYTEIGWDYIGDDINDEEFIIYTLEEFLEKYPYKVGDKVKVCETGKVFTISSMTWDDELYTVHYDNIEDIEYYTVDELKPYKETNLKTDCEKCGLHFGSVRCFDKDCPNNTPKSNVVGLKDGKVIDCKVNKEMDINDEVKPIFKVGDEIAKADGLTNSCIVTGVTSKYYSLVAPNNSGVGVLPVNKQDEYILVNRSDNKEPEPKAPILSNRYDYDEGKCGYVIPDGYEFDCIKEGFKTEIILKPKKPTYPKTYVECCKILDIRWEKNYTQGYKCGLINKFQELFIARNAYWKIAGEQMGLGKNWNPCDAKDRYIIRRSGNEILKGYNISCVLEFPSAEMRDAFYENFKELIEQCKELL